MVSPTIVLHVGAHKTGTTSLQTMVACNPDYFSRQGLHYPQAGRVGASHGNLAWELSGDVRFRAEAGTLTDLYDELDRERPHAVFVSSEDFECAYGRSQRLAALRNASERLGYSISVVVTLREPAEYIVSLYSELQKFGLAEDWSAFVAAAIEEGGVLYKDWDMRLDYSQLIDGYGMVFGPEALRVLQYNPLDSVGPVLQAFSEATGVAVSPVPEWERRNVRVDPDPGILSATQRNAIDVAFGATFDALVFAPRNETPPPRGPKLLGVIRAGWRAGVAREPAGR